MAQGADWILQSASVLWIFTLLLSESQSKKTQVYYMDGSDCDNRKILGGAMVYSQNSADSGVYSAGLECQMVFKAEREGWRLMMRLIELDIPDRTPSGICNDALYIYDDRTHYTRAMEEAGGNAGLCGSKLPPTLYSTDQYLTVHFRTDQSGPAGRGFKFIITAISEDFRNRQTCGSAFQCDNNWCIDEELMCDSVNHCGDYSDEAADGRAKCQQGQDGSGLISKFLSLGVTASIAITVGSIVIVVACIVALVCCCRRSFCKKPQDHSAVTTTTTTVVSNGAPPSNYQAPRGGAFSNHAYSHQGYYPMQPVYPTPQGSVYSSYAKENFPVAGGSVYSSHQSHQRSYTPTSSKSGRSNKSNNSTSVTYSQGTEKVSLPVNL